MDDYVILENLFRNEQDTIHFELFKESNVIKLNNQNGNDNNNFYNRIHFNTQSIASKMIIKNNYKDSYVLLKIECEIHFFYLEQIKVKNRFQSYFTSKMFTKFLRI